MDLAVEVCRFMRLGKMKSWVEKQKGQVFI